MIRMVLSIVRALNGDAHPAQVAGGALIGCMLAFTPLGVHTVALVALLLIFRVNMGMGFLFWGLLRPVAIVAKDATSVPLAQALLAPDSNTRAWIVSNLLETKWLALVKWEQHTVLGGLIGGFVLGALLFVPIVSAITAYRKTVKERIRNSKGMKVVSNNFLYKLVQGILEGDVTP